MHKKTLVFFLGFIFFGIVNAQQKGEVLLTIDNSPVYSSEFKRVYLKNIDLVKDDSQKDIDEYLNLFIDYKLKLKEAKALGLDKKKSYQDELIGYKKQLADGYLTDTKISDALVKEAYDRSQERINASHILVMVKPNASAKDTAVAYQKISEARNKINKGEKFEDVAKKYSEDPSVSKNNGNLGWFSVFRMVYPFEDAAYTTKVGGLSEPFRTSFGYHIVKVHKREKKLGEVSVAHIMIAFKDHKKEDLVVGEGLTPKEIAKARAEIAGAKAAYTPEEIAKAKAKVEFDAEQRIKEIKQQLDQSVPFESLAKQYSDDPSTAVEGGKLRRFGQGVLNSEDFEKAAFSLQNKGELSAPVKTKYGWHIIKLLEKHPIKSFTEMKNELEEKVKRDSRSKLVTKSFIDALRKKYTISKNEEAITYFKKIVSDKNAATELNTLNEELNEVFFSIKETSYTYKDFMVFILPDMLKFHPQKVTPSFIDQKYQKFEASSLLKYYEEHLEEDNQDFANIINEYRDGLLLFDLMESKVWNASKKDTIGLRKFYESQKDKYTQNETYKTLKASSSKLEVINKVKVLLQEQKSIEEIKKEINTKDIVLVIFSEEELQKGIDELPKDFLGEKEGITVLKQENFVTLIMVKEVLPSRIKTFKEAKGEIINDFQENIENQWLDQLKTKYAVKVDGKSLKKIKKELSN